MTNPTGRPSESLTIHMSNDLEMTTFARMVMRRVMPPLDEIQEPMFYGALTEVVTNAIEEHWRADHGGDVEIQVNLDPGSITIKDCGGGFDPENPPPSKDGKTGLGLVITRSVVPEIKFESGPAGTSVHLPYPEPHS